MAHAANTTSEAGWVGAELEGARIQLKQVCVSTKSRPGSEYPLFLMSQDHSGDATYVRSCYEISTERTWDVQVNCICHQYGHALHILTANLWCNMLQIKTKIRTQIICFFIFSCLIMYIFLLFYIYLIFFSWKKTQPETLQERLSESPASFYCCRH